MTYQLIDSGNGQKWERFGHVSLIRPCPQAIWEPTLSEARWEEADALFTRDSKWAARKKLPPPWEITVAGITFCLKLTEFGHLGIFPEQEMFWKKLQKFSAKRVLNLFAYSGGSTIAAAKGGAEVTHVDAAKGMVSWARQNGEKNQVDVRWIVDDAMKYLKRAVKRGERYDGIILDPPTFGRGKAGEVFKIERDLPEMLHHCKQLMRGGYILLTCHTPGFTSLVLKQLMQQLFPRAKLEDGEMALHAKMIIPSGSYVLAHF